MSAGLILINSRRPPPAIAQQETVWLAQPRTGAARPRVPDRASPACDILQGADGP